MKKILTLIALSLCLCAGAVPKKTPLRVGTYELTNSGNRSQQVKSGKASAQRLWSSSACAVADAIINADCDILGIQDVCDSIAGRREGVKPLIDIIRERGGDYDWLILSNCNPNFPLDGPLSSGNGIIWKASRFELRDWGIYWLSGIYDKPGRDKSLKYGSPNTSMTWVLLYDKLSDRELYFVSSSLSGPTQHDKGQKVIYNEINVANARNLISLAKDEVVPKGMPSVIVLNAHNAPSHEGCKTLTGSNWFDVYDRLAEEGSLGEEVLKIKDLCNSADERQFQGGRPDHILVDGFSIESYNVLRQKFPTSDGTAHYPSFHFPVVAQLQY